MTAKADSRHGVVGNGIALLFIFLAVLSVFPNIMDAMKQRKWRRRWERTHGKAWSERGSRDARGVTIDNLVKTWALVHG
jgi:hypothetical protein